jgi:hypothetical protein
MFDIKDFILSSGKIDWNKFADTIRPNGKINRKMPLMPQIPLFSANKTKNKKEYFQKDLTMYLYS